MSAFHPRSEAVSDSVSLFRARTPTLPPATHTNSYALGTREILLVEPATPYGDEQREWLAWARGQKSAGRTLVGIFLTHHHVDHVGGQEIFARELGLPRIAHAETAARLDVPIEKQLADGDAILLDGPTPEKWSVLHTPGHAAGHLCLLSDRGALVAGDMVASVGTILIAPGEGHMTTYLRELARLRDLDANLVLPAHGDPVHTPRALFDHYIAHRKKREGVVLQALASFQGGASLDELLPRAYADVGPETHPIARLSLEAHLEKLIEEGRVRREDAIFRAIAIGA